MASMDIIAVSTILRPTCALGMDSPSEGGAQKDADFPSPPVELARERMLSLVILEQPPAQFLAVRVSWTLYI